MAARWRGVYAAATTQFRRDESLDAAQEIHYPAVMRALVEIGYQGHVGQEFIPTRDAWAGLSQAVAACDVA